MIAAPHHDKYEHVSKYGTTNNKQLNEQILDNHRMVMQKSHKGGKKGKDAQA